MPSPLLQTLTERSQASGSNGIFPPPRKVKVCIEDDEKPTLPSFVTPTEKSSFDLTRPALNNNFQMEGGSTETMKNRPVTETMNEGNSNTVYTSSSTYMGLHAIKQGLFKPSTHE